MLNSSASAKNLNQRRVGLKVSQPKKAPAKPEVKISLDDRLLLTALVDLQKTVEKSESLDQKLKNIKSTVEPVHSSILEVNYEEQTLMMNEDILIQKSNIDKANRLVLKEINLCHQSEFQAL